MTITTNYGLRKPAATEIVDIDDLNFNSDKIDTELKKAQSAAAAAQTTADSAFQSASDGKAALVAALVAMGVSASTSESFSSLAAKIKAIKTGIDTSDATATAAQILKDRTAYAKGSKLTGTIPSKAAATITPGTANQTIAAGQYLSGVQTIVGDADLVTGNIRAGVNLFGVVGKSSVVETSSANATAAQMLKDRTAFVNGSKITGTIPSKAAATITPKATNQTIAAGQYLSGIQTIVGDTDLVAGNIKAGVNIFGVVGAFEGSKPNGKIWKKGNIPDSSKFALQHGVYGNGGWLAGNSSNNFGAWVSANGVDWSRPNLGNMRPTFSKSCYYANGKTYYSCNKGVFYPRDSFDGWAPFMINQRCNFCYYSNGMWVVCTPTGLVYTDDIAGDNYNGAGVSGDYKICHCGGGVWVAAKENEGLMYSVNAKSWSATNKSSGNFNWLYYDNSIWVGCSGTGLFYSENGSTWIQSNISSGTYNWCYYSDRLWVAGGSAGLLYSMDGKTWTNSNITTGTFYCCKKANGMWISSSNRGLYYSGDGKKWIQSNVTGGTFYFVDNGNGMWVAGGDANNGLWYSESA